MEGYGEAYSAVTILNAFATGLGSALGIELKTTAIVDKASKDFIETLYRGEKISIDTILLDTIARYFRERYNIEYGLYIQIDSEIPPGIGLKSSSALANALIKAFANHIGLELNDNDILNLNRSLSLEAGVSLTGALDDAAASLYGGLIITDNLKGEIIYRGDVDRERVSIVYNDRILYTKSYRGMDFTPIKEIVKDICKMLLDGLWRETAILNGLIYSGYLGHDPEPIFKALKYKPITTGLSGKGPAFYMVGGDSEKYISEMISLGYKSISTYTR